VRLLENLLSSYPYIVTSHFSDLYLSVVREQLADFKPDLILCEWTPYALYVKEVSGVRTMVTAHNIEADIWQRYFENETNALRRWYIGKQWRKVATFERTALDWVDGFIAVSEMDRNRLLGERTGLGAWVVPNGVDLDFFAPTELPKERHRLVFAGSMDWRPNQDAARYFTSEILPLLRQRRANVECCFVGRDPPDDIRALSSIPGLTITGTVDDVRPYVARAMVFVVPLRVGGGSRLKILEALAMGRPVVSTSVGAEGLDVVDGHHILIADTPEEFASAALRLLDSRELCETLASAGRRLVENRYGWEALADHLASCIHEISRVPLS
jgi:glycosyltransferase involved in cell wall biosynthesis